MQIVLAAILAIAYANPAPQPKPVAKPDLIAAAPLAYSSLSYDALPAVSLVRSDPLVPLVPSPLTYTTDIFGARLIY